MKKSSSKKFAENKKRRLIPRSEARRHFAVEKLPEDVQMSIVEKLRDGDTYQAISEFLEEKGFVVNIASLSRYFHGRVKPEFEEMKERISKRRLLVDELVKLWAGADKNQDPPEVIRQLLSSGIIANESSLTEIDPARLLNAQARQSKLELEREKLTMEREKLELLKKKIADGTVDPKELVDGKINIYLPENNR